MFISLGPSAQQMPLDEAPDISIVDAWMSGFTRLSTALPV